MNGQTVSQNSHERGKSHQHVDSAGRMILLLLTSAIDVFSVACFVFVFLLWLPNF